MTSYGDPREREYQEQKAREEQAAIGAARADHLRRQAMKDLHRQYRRFQEIEDELYGDVYWRRAERAHTK